MLCKHSSSRWYVQAHDLNCSLQVSVFVHRCAKLWNCYTHVEFAHVLGYEVIHVYVRLSDVDWSIGACRLFYSLWLQATEHSTCKYIVFLNSSKNQSHSRGNIYNNPTFTCQTPTRTWILQSFLSSCILKVTTDFFLLHSQVWQMFHNDNGGTELEIGWNSTELGDLILKAKFLTFQTT